MKPAKLSEWYGISTDIEALKQSEERLREDESELRRITDAILQAIVVQDTDGNPLYTNRATLDYTGVAMEDVAKPGFRERILHPDDMPCRRPDTKSSRLGLPRPSAYRIA
jgi:PAS domain-containing protein